jgi:hypothetical protein
VAGLRTSTSPRELAFRDLLDHAPAQDDFDTQACVLVPGVGVPAFPERLQDRLRRRLPRAQQPASGRLGEDGERIAEPDRPIARESLERG